MQVERKRQAGQRPYRLMLACLIMLAAVWPKTAWAQDITPESTPTTAEEEQAAPDQVNVQPLAQDEQIAARLTSILDATGWFVNTTVAVRDGVVFLDGQSDTQEHREWAGNLARNTQDVVAVVNRIEVLPRPLWDFDPAWAELLTLWRALILSIPLLIFAGIVLWLTWWLAKLVASLARRFFGARLPSPLLVSIAARTVAIPVFVLGVYLVLQVAGLTRLALTVLGGTGIIGIVVGFAFRDIAENFLASVLLSIRQPFRRNDLINVADQLGIVQQLNTRSTILMTIDGNYVQIPNATVFKSIIVNYSANPNRRAEFTIGIGYDDSTLQAQQVIAGVLQEHPAVLASPEPLVLVDELAASTVNLRIYFWYDAGQHAPFSVKSSLLRLIKHALQDAQISMPDEAREVIFPRGVPVIQATAPETVEQVHQELEESETREAVARAQPEPVTSAAEGHLRSDEEDARKQAEQSRTPEAGADLLDGR